MRKSLLVSILSSVSLTLSAQIKSVEFIRCWMMDLSAVGTRDWAVFGNGNQPRSVSLNASDYKKSGHGIVKTLKVSGDVKLSNDPRGQRLSWSNGTQHTFGGEILGTKQMTFGIVVNMQPGSAVSLSFDAPGGSGSLMASVYLGTAQPGIALIRQGRTERKFDLQSSTGALQVVFAGNQPLTITLLPLKAKVLQVRSLAVTLSEPALWWVRDGRLAMLYQPIAINEVLKASYKQPAPDYYKLAGDFANCMLNYGWDRYGEVKSPLFSTILTREAIPQTTPYPLFAKLENQQDSVPESQLKEKVLPARENPYSKFQYNLLLNYPQGLGEEGPHKTTLYGSDPFEDQEIYRMLIEFSRLSKDSKYKAAADSAIDFWYKNTQGPAGLYPWGEHMGWDLVYDCPVYYKEPGSYFFEANYHEVRDFVPFIERLAAIDAAPGKQETPLEKYALGIWSAHFWNKDRAWYNRHGDYNGQVDQTNEYGMFPAHLGFYMRVWTAAYLQTEKADVKAKLADCFRKTMDMALLRTKKYGFFPFDLQVDVKGKDAGEEASSQSIKLAHHCVWLATQLEKVLPDVAAGMREFASLHLGAQSEQQSLKNVEWAQMFNDPSFIQRQKNTSSLPDASLKDLSREVQSEAFANEIIQNVFYAKLTGNKAYLNLADQYGRIAKAAFCDTKSPLPTAFAYGVRSKTLLGEEFPDFYFKGAKLMRAFVLLAEAQKDK